MARTIALVVGFALLTAGAAQISFHIPGTPIPVTGQTFAVMLSGAALGFKRGAASQLLYLAMGAIGLPFFSNHTHGWSVISGSSGGYIVGFIFAAALIGLLAERGQDRNLLTSIPAMLAGTAIIYLFGSVWLAHSIHVSMAKAVELGVAPFLIGDALKIAVAGAVMPAAWQLTKDRNR